MLSLQIKVSDTLNMAVAINASIEKRLTYHHTMPHFDALKIYSCGKHCKKKRKCL